MAGEAVKKIFNTKYWGPNSSSVKSDKPFVWHNTTRMHYRTILNDKYKDKSGYGVYADGMMELDDGVGELLDLLQDARGGGQHDCHVLHR